MMGQKMKGNVSFAEEADLLAAILRNLKCDVECDHLSGYYRINQETFVGVLSFNSKARRALKEAGIIIPLP